MNNSMTHFHQDPVRGFYDFEAEVLANEGRVTIFESYGVKEKPIVVKCRKMGEGGQNHVATFADVGDFIEDHSVETVTIAGKGKNPDITEDIETVTYTVSIRPFGIQHEFNAADVDKEKALKFACEYALACFGKEFNYMADLQAQGRPTLAQTRDVLIKYGLIDPSKLPKPAPRKVRTHGGRGSNAATSDEIHSLTGALVGSA